MFPGVARKKCLAENGGSVNPPPESDDEDLSAGETSDQELCPPAWEPCRGSNVTRRAGESVDESLARGPETCDLRIVELWDYWIAGLGFCYERYAVTKGNSP